MNFRGQTGTRAGGGRGAPHRCAKASLQKLDTGTASAALQVARGARVASKSATAWQARGGYRPARVVFQIQRGGPAFCARRTIPTRCSCDSLHRHARFSFHNSGKARPRVVSF